MHIVYIPLFSPSVHPLILCIPYRESVSLLDLGSVFLYLADA